MKNLTVLMRALHLTYVSAGIGFVCLLVLIILQGLSVPLAIYISKIAVDAYQGNSQHFASMVVAWAGCILLGTLLDPYISLLTGYVNEKITARVSLLLINAANQSPDLSQFENKVFYDQLQLLNNQAPFRPLNTVITVTYVLRNAATVVGLVALLASLSWWLPLMMIVCSIPAALQSMKLQDLSWQALLGGQQSVRMMDYLRSISLSENYAKETRLFDNAKFIEKKYQTAFQDFHTQMNKDRRRLAVQPLAALVLALAASTFAFFWTLQQSSAAVIGLGGIVVVIQSLLQLQFRLTDLSAYSGLLSGHLQFFKDLHEFLSRKPNIPQGTQPAILGDIVFDNVSFNYPDGRRALEGVSFTIKAGKKIALVGENGAGKSTIIKLLCRFYEPTTGQIRVNGVDLQDINLDTWRASLAAVFQDFGRYHFTVKENIFFGRNPDDHDMHSVMEKSEVSAIIQQLPNHIESPLGKPFGGTDLSGGQWQKIAIARAYAKNASILMLDEPTSALDPRAEHELYQQFAKLIHQKTVVLVTHRLTSIQFADQILVLKSGQLIEQGTHTELIQQRGEYAQLFELQSKQFELKEELDAMTPA